MLAIDTNVVVRFLTNDDPAQSGRARALIESNDVVALSSVLLESEWVLRSTYGLKVAEVISALTTFAGLPTVNLQEPERVARALGWAADGMDFADALHLAAADDCDAFISFDQRLANLAARTDATPVRSA